MKVKQIPHIFPSITFWQQRANRHRAPNTGPEPSESPSLEPVHTQLSPHREGPLLWLIRLAVWCVWCVELWCVMVCCVVCCVVL